MLRDLPIMIPTTFRRLLSSSPRLLWRGPREKGRGGRRGSPCSAGAIPLSPFVSDFRSGTMRTEYLQVAQPRPEAWPLGERACAWREMLVGCGRPGMTSTGSPNRTRHSLSEPLAETSPPVVVSLARITCRRLNRCHSLSHALHRPSGPVASVVHSAVTATSCGAWLTAA